MLSTASVFDFEVRDTRSIRVEVRDEHNASLSKEFSVQILNDTGDDEQPNQVPVDLQTNGVLSIMENQSIGTMVGQFSASDADGDELFFSLVSGVGDTDNAEFALSSDGVLSTALVFDFELGDARSIRVDVRDEHKASLSKEFLVSVLDDPNDELQVEQDEFVSDGNAGLVGQLKILGRDDLEFRLGPDSLGAMHLFLLQQNGILELADDALESKTYELRILIFKENNLVDEKRIKVVVEIKNVEDFEDTDTTDSAYHESALMIRELKVVRDNWRNGHNPILMIDDTEDGLFLTTAQPHGRKSGDSVVLSGVAGLEIQGIRNWNFIIDEVSVRSFRLRKFGRDIQGRFDGSLGEIARAKNGTVYIPSRKDFLLGPWTFGHLLGNMVSELDDPLIFYKHFANQWKKVQTVNGWQTDERRRTNQSLLPKGELTLANLPFRLLAIGNRIDLFHAKSIRQVGDAGEGRFVFTLTRPLGGKVSVSEEDEEIWRVHEKTEDETDFTLIFEYGQPAADFATLSKWAKDWHKLEVGQNHFNNKGNFSPTEEYLGLLNELTDRFSTRGADPVKPNGNPINQVRTNEFINMPWQMREFNLLTKDSAHQVKAADDRETLLDVGEDAEIRSIDIGLWTTTTKNNPMVEGLMKGNIEKKLIEPLKRWINKNEHQILDGDTSARSPEWMEGPVANEPLQFTYQIPRVRVNLARHKFSLSTCSGCHTGDTSKDTRFQFQMVHSTSRRGNQKARFVPFMVGDGNGGMHVVKDRVNSFEKHEFFDLKEREEIARDILSIAQQVDSARLRLTTPEISLHGQTAAAHVFIRGGIIGDWQFDLPEGREDNDLYTLNSSTGELSLRGAEQQPRFGPGKIYLRARATDGTGVVVERPYDVWILSSGESPMVPVLDSSIQPGTPPPLTTPRMNRPH